MSPQTNAHRPERSFAIIGHPVGHYLSPLLYETAFRQLGLSYSYERIDVTPDLLAARISEFRATLAGFNVTIPHKQSIMQFLDAVSEEAQSVGAVNTVVNKDGRLVGYNTDIDGIIASLKPVVGSTRRTHAVLLGAGGSARAVLHVLTRILQISSVTIAARRASQMEQLVRDFDGAQTRLITIPFSSAALSEAIRSSSILINTTPIGMHPRILDCPLDATIQFPEGFAVLDLIYRPMCTVLLQRASAAGCAAIGGLEMLLHQGKRAFELYTGKELPLDSVRDQLVRSLSAEEASHPR